MVIMPISQQFFCRQQIIKPPANASPNFKQQKTGKEYSNGWGSHLRTNCSAANEIPKAFAGGDELPEHWWKAISNLLIKWQSSPKQ
ncbi:MAG: hypothetical protein JWP81_2792 [Ferruginibacter sp.]|nr:hypothetical protein [Ferruginibacter sp.]